MPRGSSWPPPRRLLLLTYDRQDHILPTVEQSVVGVAADRASFTKAKRVRRDDWVLIRLSQFDEFRAVGPARITGKPVDQRSEPTTYPDLLWPEEVEQSRIIYPLRIPVTFDGSPGTRAECVTWGALAALRLRGKDGYVLSEPQQWGRKFTTNVLDQPSDVQEFVDLIDRCALQQDGK